VRIDGAGTGIYVPCLGSNHVAHYLLDAAAGSLAPAGIPTTTASGGPRHMVFHPSGKAAYVLAELSSRIHVYNVNAATGSLEARPDDTVLTNDDGDNWSSDIKITPDGKFVYAVNRDPNEIVSFAVQADQSLMRLLALPLTGTVRSFAMDPQGKFLQIGGSDGLLSAYSINQETGALSAGTTVNNLGNIHNTEIHYLPD
jgi:6-phosphogluconolactonase